MINTPSLMPDHNRQHNNQLNLAVTKFYSIVTKSDILDAFKGMIKMKSRLKIVSVHLELSLAITPEGEFCFHLQLHLPTSKLVFCPSPN